MIATGDAAAVTRWRTAASSLAARAFGSRRARLLAWGAAAFLGAGLCAWGCLMWLASRPLAPEAYVATPSSPELRGREGMLLYAFLNPEEQWCFPRPLEGMSPYLVQATIATEDQRFRTHGGVDSRAVLRAAIQNFRGGGVVSGASTLTMQLVKLSEQNPRSLTGKVNQAIHAMRLEHALGKDEILNAYLNKSPYGLNLVGAEAAARRYFGKPAAELSLAEAALLAGIPKSPAAFEPLRHPKNAKARRDFVLARMAAEGYINEDERERAAEQPLGAAWHEFPKRAPHMAMALQSAGAAHGVMQTTLDANLQAEAEERLRRYLLQFNREVTNGAIMIADVETGGVLARAGSADFNAPDGGQVDLCGAPRSPGSALKPFVYALALEQSQLYPSERLLDDTLDYGRYAPGNYDGEFNGLVSATEALQYSLNVPAVMILDRLGTAPFRACLERLGLTTLTEPAGYYGLGLALGNADCRLDEVTAAYTALANLGVYRPLHLREPHTGTAGTQVFARGTVLALYAMLEQPLPREESARYVQAGAAPVRVCWKTGTSTGHCDAWSFVFNRQYVVGVWLGNNNATASKWLVGATAALPLAAALFRSMEPKPSPAWPEAEGELKPVEICAVSGLPANPHCAARKTVWLPRLEFLHRRCGVHVADGAGTAEQWPAGARRWDLAKIDNPVGIERVASKASKAPKEETARVGLKILNPADRAEYVYTGAPGADRIALRTGLPPGQTVHWYLNGRYLGDTPPEGPLFLELFPGSHELSCMTAGGETDAVRFEVVRPGVHTDTAGG